jgi:antitoxin ChpS
VISRIFRRSAHPEAAPHFVYLIRHNSLKRKNSFLLSGFVTLRKSPAMELTKNYALPASNVIFKYNIWRCSMYITRLKKVGGSVMLAVPPAVLKTLALSADSEVGMTIDNGRLVIEPQKRPRYSLEELLAQCDPHAEMSEEDREWIDAPAVGKEIL